MAHYHVSGTAAHGTGAQSALPAAPTPTERRKADRPWTGTSAATAARTRTSTRAANGANETEWKEF
jgi:hypothetical protein